MNAVVPRDILITLSNAGVMRGGRTLVSGVDLTIARGEIVTLIGPNGSGKSTTAKLATGVMKPMALATENGCPAIQSAATLPMSANGTLPMMINASAVERYRV